VYTQCSKCETVFRLSAEALRAAGGQVRCGRCGEVFNALARLAEEPTAFPAGESSLESESRADAILQSAEPVPPAAPPTEEGDEIAHLKVLDAKDEELDLEASLEFTLPPGELDRIFIETSPSPLQLLAASVAASVKASAARGAPAAAPAVPVEPAQTGSTPTPTPQTASTQTASNQNTSGPTVSAPTAPGSTASRRTVPGPTVPASAPGVATSSTPPQTESAATARIPGLTVSEDIRQEMLASYQRAELPEINAPRRQQLPQAVWVSAAAALALLLVFQIVATNGTWLSVHTPLLEGAKPAAVLSTYQLRQWGVTGDPGANGTLRVRASIMNAAAQLQPYPLLRVTLADRFGTRLGAREFEPAEYLGRAPARMLAPGERADATLNILDPGKDAEGFEIDVCIRSIEKKVVCAGDVGAAAGRQSK
jgi:predicted Zn finger-like uncharacterized protein